MKKGARFFLLLFLAAVAFAAFVWFQSDRLLRSPRVQDYLIQKIQNVSGGLVSHDGIEIKLLPQPAISLLKPSLTFTDGSATIRADSIRFDFNIIPMAWGRVEPSGICVFGGQADAGIPWFPVLGPLQFRNVALKMGAIRPNLPIPVQMTSDVGDRAEALGVKGHVVIPSVEKPDWNKTNVRLLIDFKGLPLVNPGKMAGEAGRFFAFKNGILDGSFEVKKQPEVAAMNFSGTGRIVGLSYEVLNGQLWNAPEPFDLDMDITGAWNASAEELTVSQSSFRFPFGVVESNGTVKLGTGEIPSLFFTSREVALEKLVTCWPGVENALPLQIGFSGMSQWNLSLEGTLDHLSLHLNLDFGPALLTYGNYFAKPKDVPFLVTFDYLVQKGSVLSGDFSVRFQEMSLKGNLTDLDMATAIGQLNLLTNKFSMTGWEKFVPALQGYQVRGDAKLLANWKGDLRHFDKTEQIFHVTIENGALTGKDGKGVGNANFSFDYSPLMLEGREMKFEIGGSALVADLKVTQPGVKSAVWARLSSGELRVEEFWDAVMALFRKKADPASGRDVLDHVKTSIGDLFPSGQTLKDFSAELAYSDGQWDVPKFHAQVYGGMLDLAGSLDLSAKPIGYLCEGEAKGLDFASFLTRSGQEQPPMTGSLTLKFSLHGNGWGKDNWAGLLGGKGRFTLSNGRVNFIDLPGAVATITPFSGIRERLKDPGAFSELDFNWSLFDGKVMTDNFLTRGSDYVVAGEGTLGFDGLTNFRWDVFFPTTLAAEIFPEMAGTFQRETRAHLGPITMLVTGPLSAPEIKPDPAQVEELVEKIRNKKARSLLFELVLD